MPKTYMAIEMFVAAHDDDERHLIIKTDTLDGQRNSVELCTKDKHGDYYTLGWFDADQLIEAIRTVQNVELPYIEETLRKRKQEELEKTARRNPGFEMANDFTTD